MEPKKKQHPGELDKAVVRVISLISFLWLWFSFCLSSDW